ncbi:RNA methyltransferase [Chitinilyticum litopenaei]|uniref:RNA methyltransferase n=1 Tax=Chitinilyticum piscinae TaxID=2866724 RepID=A0A8J7FH85_9NEIS|nr:RNA methyltransferase [Chitinilyticum piscinae]
MIHSAQNPVYKHLLKLATHRRERLKTHQTLLDGAHLLQSWLAAGLPIECIYITEDALANPEITALLDAATAIPRTLLSADLFRTVSELPSPTGILALIDIPDQGIPLKSGFCLALDGIQDPGNVGSILRTAVAAGVEQVWLSPGCADVWSPKVLRAGMGAHASVQIIERIPLEDACQCFAGNIAATMLDGASDLYDTDLHGDLLLVMGSEGSGVSTAIASQATRRIRIPMVPGIESLNVAAATAICLFERVRQTRS